MSVGEFITTNFDHFLQMTGFANTEYTNLVMIAVGTLFIWLAIRKNFEPLLLVPIGLGIIIGNIPFREGMEIGIYEDNSVLNFFYQGVRDGWYPPLVFLGIGAMTDFSSLISNPKLILIGAAATLFFLAKALLLKLKLVFAGKKDGGAQLDSSYKPYVIYNEGNQYWNTFKPVCDEFEKRGIALTYYTSSSCSPS